MPSTLITGDPKTTSNLSDRTFPFFFAALNKLHLTRPRTAGLHQYTRQRLAGFETFVGVSD